MDRPDYDEELVQAFMLDMEHSGMDPARLRCQLLQARTIASLDEAARRRRANLATTGATTDVGMAVHHSPPLSSEGEVDGDAPEGASTTHNAGVAGSSPAPAIAGQGVTDSGAPSATTVATTGPDFASTPHPYGGWL